MKTIEWANGRTLIVSERVANNTHFCSDCRGTILIGSVFVTLLTQNRNFTYAHCHYECIRGRIEDNQKELL